MIINLINIYILQIIIFETIKLFFFLLNKNFHLMLEFFCFIKIYHFFIIFYIRFDINYC